MSDWRMIDPVSERDDDIEKLRAEIARLQEDRDMWQVRAEEFSKEMERLREEVAAWKVRAEQQFDHAQATARALKDQHDEIAQLKDGIKLRDGQIYALRIANSGLQAAIDM